MRITQSTVEQLADEAERVTGKTMISSINHPGDGQTRYVMNESMTSTYRGARTAAAYLLGVLAGADPDGPVNWIEHRPGWVAEVDHEFRFGEIGKPAVRAYQAGTEYGRSLRREPRSQPREDRYSIVVTYQDRTRVHTVGAWDEITEWLPGQNSGGVPVASAEIGRVIAEGVMPS